MAGRQISRRRFGYLCIGGVTVAVTGVIGCDNEGSQSLEPRVGRFVVGIPEDYIEGDLFYFSAAPLLAGLDSLGFYAMSAICTHANCDIGNQIGEITEEGPISCFCHNSVFSRTGEIMSGPAPLSLQHYQLELEDGQLICDTSSAVPSDTRLVVV